MASASPDQGVAPENDRAPWSPRDTTLGALLTLVPLVAILLPNLFAAAKTIPPLSPPADWVSAIVTFVLTGGLEAVFLIAPLYFARRRGGVEGNADLGLRPFPAGGVIGLALLGMAVVFALGIGLDALTQALFHTTLGTNLDQLLQLTRQEPRTTVAATLAAVLVAPVCEEIFFRGFLLQGLRNAMPTGWAVVVSALIFAAAHVSPGSFPLLFALGVLLGIMRVTTRSLYPGIALHTLNNALGLAQVILLVAK